jgi:acetylornithine/N-succinyldiaminopimelate aminotransferase
MYGIQLSRPGRPFVDAALERGLLINCTQETVLRMLPPYIIQAEEMDQAVQILDEVFSAEPVFSGAL